MSEKKSLEELFETPELSEEECEQVSGGLTFVKLIPPTGDLTLRLESLFQSGKFGALLRPSQDVGH